MSISVGEYVDLLVRGNLTLISYGARIDDDLGGGGRVLLSDEWKMDVENSLARAVKIFLVPDETEGVAWELSTIQLRGWLYKTVIIFPYRSVLNRNMREAELASTANSVYRKKIYSLFDQLSVDFVSDEFGCCIATYDRNGYIQDVIPIGNDLGQVRQLLFPVNEY